MRNIINKKIPNYIMSNSDLQTLLLSLLLGVLVIAVLGQWEILFILIGMTIIFGINALNFSMLYQMYRNVGSDDYYHPFSCMLNSLADSHQERIEPKEEDFKPFVFKDNPEDSGHE